MNYIYLILKVAFEDPLINHVNQNCPVLSEVRVSDLNPGIYPLLDHRKQLFPEVGVEHKLFLQ